MRAFLLLLAVWQVSAAGRLQVLLPDDHMFNEGYESFDADSLLNFNKKAFGIQTGPDMAPTVSGGKLFEKPKALVVISIKGLDDFNYDGHVFNFTDNFHSGEMKKELQNHFGEEMIHVDLNSSGIFGSHNFKRNVGEANVDASNLQDIQNMYLLAKAIKEKDRKSANAVDYYRIHLDVSNARSMMEKKQLEENLKKGIDTLQEAIRDSYGGNVIAQIYTHEQISEKKAYDKLMRIRKRFNVAPPRSLEFPASFAICMMSTFVLCFGATSMIWFMWDENEMGKNSLVYRLSTGRQKKD